MSERTGTITGVPSVQGSVRREDGHVKRAFVSVIAAPVLVVTCLMTSGCQSDNTVAADCQGQIRIGDEIFTSYGYTKREATRQGVADQADCQDVGKDAAGSVFPEDPQHVPTWRFDGYSPDKVLGVRLGRDGFHVFVVDSVPLEERARILAALSHPAP